jgi:benzoyl-CoA reductase/2-hydroxyglutaryl-CoA dehydratase subunit BcrC/BadD/HgdB
MVSYYGELLRLCGFEDDEIAKEGPRIEKAFQKLSLATEDMRSAEIWVRQNHDVQLLGVKKILGIWLRELVDLVLAKEEGKKLVYFGFPTIAGPAAAIAAASEELFCTAPDVVLCYSMGQIFNKLGPILEAGEENGLPQGHGLCSLQQIRVGGLAKGIIPIPDLVLTSSYFCDMGSKTDEYLHEKYAHPAMYIDGSMDSRWGEYPAHLPERVDLLGGQLEGVFEKVKEVLGVEINEDARYEGALRGREIHAALGELAELMKGADPQPVSIVEAELARRLTNGSTSRRIINEGPKAVSLLNQEVKERIDKGVGIGEKGAPRVMIALAHFSDPSIMRMMENSGLTIPGTLFSLMTLKVRKATPFISGEILAGQEMSRGIYHGTYGLCKRAVDAVKELRVDGVIWNYLYNCRPLSLPSHLLKQVVEKETGLPVLSLEMDMYDSRSYSAESLKIKVEAFAEMLRTAQNRAIT